MGTTSLLLRLLTIDVPHARDLTGPNIMMDARPILPHGWHFVRTALAPNGVDPVHPLPRIDHHVRYIIIDYDNSVRFRPGQSRLINLPGGRDQEVPELKRPRGGSRQIVPYDAFKLDVFTVGNLFSKELHQACDTASYVAKGQSLNENSMYPAVPWA
jgi:hypothetical protein